MANSLFSLIEQRTIGGGGGPPSGPAGGVLTGTYPNPGLNNTGVTANTYPTGLNNIAAFTVGADGRLTFAYNQLFYNEPLTIASLSPNSVWNPIEWVGPGRYQYSSGSYGGYQGSGWATCTKGGKAINFKLTVAGSSGTDFDVQIWQATGGDPFTFSFTGVTITLPANTYYATNTTDAIAVAEGDFLVAYNPSFSVGFSPGTLTLTTDVIP